MQFEHWRHSTGGTTWARARRQSGPATATTDSISQEPESKESESPNKTLLPSAQPWEVQVAMRSEVVNEHKRMQVGAEPA